LSGSGGRHPDDGGRAAPGAGAPYAELTPERMLAAIDSTGLRTDGRLLALNSYENRVYQVGLDDPGLADLMPGIGAAEGNRRFVISKFYRPGRWSDAAIAEEHAFSRELVEAELPVVAPLVIGGKSLFGHAGFRFALFPRVGGRAPELEQAEVATRLGRLLARVHAVGARSRFGHREALDVAHLVDRPSRAALASGLIPAHVESRYRAAISQAREAISARLQACGPLATLRLHGDCHPGNVLWNADGPTLVDLDDTRSGPAVQDLWMLMTGEPAQRKALLEGYGEFRDFDPSELHLIDALRLMRQIHYGGWLAERWGDPAFPRAFPFVGEARWWEGHVQDVLEGGEAIADA